MVARSYDLAALCVKQFFFILPGNIIKCFKGRLIVWHILAIVLVTSGFDWLFFRSTREPLLRAWMFPAAPIGGLVPIALPLILIVFGTIMTKSRITLTGWAIGQAEFIASLVSSAYKAVTGRAHPSHDVGVDISHVFHFGFLRGGVFWGWPSSHTTIAFAMAVTVFILYPKPRWLGYVAMAYALYIGIGVSMTIHWFSDFVAGAIIGAVIGTVVGRSYLDSLNLARTGR